MNFKFGRRSLQFLFWNPLDAEAREHIGFGYGRWPTGNTLAECRKMGWRDFGFHGVVVGPFEVRYWPNRRGPKPDSKTTVT